MKTICLDWTVTEEICKVCGGELEKGYVGEANDWKYRCPDCGYSFWMGNNGRGE